MRWNNVQEIAQALEDSYGDQEIENLRQARLHKWIVQLLDFDDDPGKFNERLLENIQNEWQKIREENE